MAKVQMINFWILSEVDNIWAHNTVLFVFVSLCGLYDGPKFIVRLSFALISHQIAAGCAK